MLASTVPAVQAYDPAFAYEVSTIVQAGINRMYGGGPPELTDVFYYITLYNENYEMPAMPDTPGLTEQIMEGLYKWADAPEGPSKPATILFSGIGPHRGPRGRGRAGRALRRRRRAVVGHVVQDAARRGDDGRAVQPPAPVAGAQGPARHSRLAEAEGPIIAVSDFMTLVPEQVIRFLPGRTFVPLGTDGMGRSDTREALRRHFEVDTGHVVVGVLSGLLADGVVDASVVDDAIARYDIDPDAADPFLS